MSSTATPIAYDPAVVGNLDDDDNDSFADDSSLRESTASLTSSIFESRTIFGRSYQSSKTTEYWAPKDEKHINGLDIAHQMLFHMLDDKLFQAPIRDDPQYILDVGTGTGIWAIDVADEYPSAEVIGTDISAVQPGWVPPNCIFQIDDAQQPWTFKENHFDFVHARMLYGGIDDWPRLYQQAFTHLKPGGWFQSIEPDIETLSENPRILADNDHVFKQWCQLFWQAGDKTGRTFRFARDGQMEKAMKDAGFVDIVHKQWKAPIGGWAVDRKLKLIGQYNGAFIDESLDGFAIFPVGQILGWTFEEVHTLVAKMREAFADKKTLPYYTMHMVYGRKPGGPEDSSTKPSESETKKPASP